MEKIWKYLLFDNAHLPVFSNCLRIDVSSWTTIQHLQIVPSKHGTQTSESRVLKMFYLYVSSVWLSRWAKLIWWYIEENCFFKLFEFPMEWIPTSRNKAEIIFGFKNYIHCCNCWQKKKIISVSVALCSTPQSAVQRN